MPKYTRKWRQRRQSHKQRGGQVTFRNNTKQPNNSNNYSHLPSKYLRNVRSLLPDVSRLYANDAEILAGIQNTYDDPANMKEALYLVYDPQPLTDAEMTVAQKLLTQGLKKAIGRANAAPIPLPMKMRILNNLRFQRQLDKIAHYYERNYVSKYTHPEWNEKLTL